MFVVFGYFVHPKIDKKYEEVLILTVDEITTTME